MRPPSHWRLYGTERFEMPSEADLAVRGDADGLVAVPFPGLPIGRQEHPGGVPPVAPLRLAQTSVSEVVPGVRHAAATTDDVHDPGVPVGSDRCTALLQRGQASRLGEPLLPGLLPAGCALCSRLPDRYGQAVPDGRDPSVQRIDVRSLATAGP